MYSVRPARRNDLDRLVQLLLALQEHLEASNPDLWRMKEEGRARLRAQLNARLSAANTCALVAEHTEDGVIGAIFGRLVINKRYDPSQAGVVDQVFVAEDHRRAGVGSRLVAGVCTYFAEKGVEDLSLRYVAGNQEAASFWLALGFSPRIVTAGACRQEVEAVLVRHRGE